MQKKNLIYKEPKGFLKSHSNSATFAIISRDINTQNISIHTRKIKGALKSFLRIIKNNWAHCEFVRSA